MMMNLAGWSVDLPPPSRRSSTVYREGCIRGRSNVGTLSSVIVCRRRVQGTWASGARAEATAAACVRVVHRWKTYGARPPSAPRPSRLSSPLRGGSTPRRCRIRYDWAEIASTCGGTGGSSVQTPRRRLWWICVCVRESAVGGGRASALRYSLGCGGPPRAAASAMLAGAFTCCIYHNVTMTSDVCLAGK